jgi:hypothetical protein
MTAWTTLALVFITLCTATTAAIGQKVYRCGSEYSHVPCADAVVVEADDPRSPAQKVQSDTMIQRNTAAARALEKTLQEEEATRPAESAAHNATPKKKKHVAKQHAASALTAAQTSAINESKAEPKAKKVSKKKESAYFTARVAPTPKADKRHPKE